MFAVRSAAQRSATKPGALREYVVRCRRCPVCAVWMQNYMQTNKVSPHAARSSLCDIISRYVIQKILPGQIQLSQYFRRKSLRRLRRAHSPIIIRSDYAAIAHISATAAAAVAYLLICCRKLHGRRRWRRRRRRRRQQNDNDITKHQPAKPARKQSVYAPSTCDVLPNAAVLVHSIRFGLLL